MKEARVPQKLQYFWWWLVGLFQHLKFASCWISPHKLLKSWLVDPQWAASLFWCSFSLVTANTSCPSHCGVLLINGGDFGRERWRSHCNLYRDGCHLILSVSQGFIKETCKGRESSDASLARDFPQDYSGEGSTFYKYGTGQIQREELIHNFLFSPK